MVRVSDDRVRRWELKLQLRDSGGKVSPVDMKEVRAMRP